MTAAWFESALRALVLALAVWAGLRTLGVRNVVALKAAWGLVLCAALAMPLLISAAARWNLVPANLAVVLPAQAPRWVKALWPLATHPAVPVAHAAPEAAAAQPTVKLSYADVAELNALIDAESTRLAKSANVKTLKIAPKRAVELAIPATAGADRYPAPVVAQGELVNASRSNDAARAGFHLIKQTAVDIAWISYFAIAATLLGRMIYGLAVALRLCFRAKPVTLGTEPDLADGLDLRSSSDVASPVTIGSIVILPDDYAQWSSEKLRIVLAHERSHIRQRDFYLQLAAGAYAALFWVSPLGWWLKRKLSELAEAISDRAGLEEAASRSAYAQVLLEFAALPRPTRLGVAMARTGNLTRRIERLLNETTFRQAYADTRLRAFAAVLLVPAALFAATATIHVQAAAQTQEPAPPAPADTSTPAPPAMPPAPASTPAPAAAPNPLEGQSTPPPEAPEVTEPMPAPEAAPSLAPPPAVPQAPGVAPVPPTPGVAPLPPTPPAAPLVLEDDDDAPTIAAWDDANGKPHKMKVERGMVMRMDDNGDTYILVRGNGSYSVSGGAENEALQKARKMAKGDFILYTHDGKSYVIDDPATVAQIEATFSPMRAWAVKARILSDQQKGMAIKERAMAERAGQIAEKARAIADKQQVYLLQHKQLTDDQAAAILHSQDLKKQMANLNATMARLQAEDDKKLTDADLASVRAQVAELQAKLGAMQWHLDAMATPKIDIEIPKIDIDEHMALEMSRLGEEQSRLAQIQDQMSKENDKKVKAIIQESLKNGMAKPIQ
jgi:bla regulator protein blaR1